MTAALGWVMMAIFVSAAAVSMAVVGGAIAIALHRDAQFSRPVITTAVVVIGAYLWSEGVSGWNWVLLAPFFAPFLYILLFKPKSLS